MRAASEAAFSRDDGRCWWFWRRYFASLYADEVLHFSHKWRWWLPLCGPFIFVLSCGVVQYLGVFSRSFWFTDNGDIALLKEAVVLFCQTSALLWCFQKYCINLLFLTTVLFSLGGTLYSHVTSVITFAVNVIHLLLTMSGNCGENNTIAGVTVHEAPCCFWWWLTLEVLFGCKNHSGFALEAKSFQIRKRHTGPCPGARSPWDRAKPLRLYTKRIIQPRCDPCGSISSLQQMLV